MAMGRREWLQLGIVGGLGAAGGYLFGRRKSAALMPTSHVMSADSLYSQGIQPPEALGPLALDRSLIPPPFVRGPRQHRIIDLQVEEGPLEVARGATINAWSFNGQVPGPIIRATEGDDLTVNFRNRGAHPQCALPWSA